MTTPRKPLLISGLAILLYLGLGFLVHSQAAPLPNLAPLAKARGVHLGAAVTPQYLGERSYRDTLVNHFSYLSPENAFKHDALVPAQGRFSFAAADQIADFAKQNSMALRGHTLVWHNQNPAWFSSLLGKPDEGRAYLRQYITTVMQRYRGVIRDWDVVNEAFDERGQLRTESLWYRIIGPDYIDLAFKIAREADPQARLFINDYSAETMNAKSDGVFNWVKEARARGVPVDGVGFQFHVDGAVPFDLPSAASNMKRFASLGVDIQFTEVDLRLPRTNATALLDTQAKLYGDLLRLGLSTPGFTAFITWGVGDKYSWVPGFFNGFDDPLLFDKQWRPKPAAFAVADVLREKDLGVAWLDARIQSVSAGRNIPPFRASAARTLPTIDGLVSAGEWDQTYRYPMAFNQLDSLAPGAPVPSADLRATWHLTYRANKIYGLVERTDNATVTTMTNRYDSDNLEVFFQVGTVWKQYRSVAGARWDNAGAQDRIVWSADGRVAEFEVTLPAPDLTGLTIGWNIALSDNDDAVTRLRQVYPIPGSNQGWSGKDFGEMIFQGGNGLYIAGPLAGAPPAFKAARLRAAPVLDGNLADEWRSAVRYPLSYHQAGALDQVPPPVEDFAAQWSVAWHDKSLYGYIDTQGANNDRGRLGGATLWLKGPQGTREVVLVPGQALNQAGFTVAWSSDGRRAEWRWDLGTEVLKSGQRVEINLGAGPGTMRLFPVAGFSRVADQGNLSDQMTRQGQELFIVQLD